MPTNEPEEKFEKRLRQFQPMQPRPLTLPQHRHVPWGMLAVATVLVAIGIGILRHSWTIAPNIQHSPMDQPAAVLRPITLGQLNSAFRRSDQDLDRIFDKASPRLLTRQYQGSALYELGKE